MTVALNYSKFLWWLVSSCFRYLLYFANLLFLNLFFRKQLSAYLPAAILKREKKVGSPFSEDDDSEDSPVPNLVHSSPNLLRRGLGPILTCSAECFRELFTYPHPSFHDPKRLFSFGRILNYNLRPIVEPKLIAKQNVVEHPHVGPKNLIATSWFFMLSFLFLHTALKILVPAI